MDLSKRKSNRLKDYDYSQNGAYFITMCIKDNQEILWTDIGASCARPKSIDLDSYHLSENGLIVEKEIRRISEIYGNIILVDKYVVMPNHIHLIIFVNYDSERPQIIPTISRIIQQFKGCITKQIGFSAWQKSFYDRIIRNEAEYKNIWNYIDVNPQKWEEDCFYGK